MNETYPAGGCARGPEDRLTRNGHKLLETGTGDWEQTAVIIARFFDVKAEDLS
jgi:hypothetical protein